jgi:hypothetical protein
MKAIQITKITEDACRRVFLNEHSKFATKSMMLKEDLDREFEFDDRTFTIVGQWINEGMLDIVIKDSNKNYYRANHKEVSSMMGYKNYRNAVTGIEHNTEESIRRLVEVSNEIPDSDVSEEDINFLENIR